MVNDTEGESLAGKIMDRNVSTIQTFKEGDGNLRPDFGAGEIKSAEARNNY